MSTAITHTLSGATAGDWHRFRVRAHNAHGWGAYSATLEAQAAEAPATPSAVVTTLSSASIRITWAAPSSNWKAITAYDVEIKVAGGASYVAQATHCDASAGSPAAANLYCEVPVVSVLRAAPYSLQLQDLVIARVRAINERGAGGWSADNTAGAKI